MSDSSTLDEQIAYSCVEARVFDCVCDRGVGEEELCDSENSILEKAAEKLMDRGFPSKNRGSREDEQIAYSCVEARVFDCVCDRGVGEEELCDSENSILEKAAEKLMDRGFPSKNRGSREGNSDPTTNVALTAPILCQYISLGSKEIRDLKAVSEERPVLISELAELE
ncbi:hypothetical protein SASPL_136784 [Salvia splendens]|uniref:Uncharacterized protein n=1 Tax=Salvia splendens TaxID=180675 RepID=A0A8X8WYV9_SALSN|nr:hypothetical protein SASPL_136784 [Salvia splendens]